MEEYKRPKYPMAMVRKMTGLTDRQIRYYEEVGLIKPIRTRGNHRIFTAEEVEKLIEIKNLVGEGFTIEMIKATFSIKDEPSLSQVYLTPNRVLPGMKRGLTSLYPVSNRAQLVEMILQKRKERKK